MGGGFVIFLIVLIVFAILIAMNVTEGSNPVDESSSITSATEPASIPAA